MRILLALGNVLSYLRVRYHGFENVLEVSRVYHFWCSSQNPCHLRNSYPNKKCRAGVDNGPVVLICSKDAVVYPKAGVKELNGELAWKEGAIITIGLNLV